MFPVVWGSGHQGAPHRTRILPTRRRGGGGGGGVGRGGGGGGGGGGEQRPRVRLGWGRFVRGNTTGLLAEITEENRSHAGRVNNKHSLHRMIKEIMVCTALH